MTERVLLKSLSLRLGVKSAAERYQLCPQPCWMTHCACAVSVCMRVSCKKGFLLILTQCEMCDHDNQVLVPTELFGKKQK